jgi:hypothetical protein
MTKNFFLIIGKEVCAMATWPGLRKPTAKHWKSEAMMKVM